MIKTIRRGAAALLAAIVLTGSLTGCGTWSNTKIVLTTGLTGDQLFKVGKSVCTLPEAMIYVMDYKQQYENAYGVEMWEHDFGGVTLEEYIGALGAYTPEQPLHAEAGGRGFDIFRVPLGPEGARFDAPRDRVWQASADNCGGLVVTVWGAV